jgi:glucokinase
MNIVKEKGDAAVFVGDDADIASSRGLKYLSPWNRYLGVVEMAKREVERGVGTKVVSLSGGDVDKVTEAVVVDAARQNDETALNIVQSVAINLGLRTAYLINLFHPDMVVISGGPEKASELTLPLINKMIKRLSMRKYADTIKIIPSTFGEDGICLGASALAVREVFLKS